MSAYASGPGARPWLFAPGDSELRPRAIDPAQVEVINDAFTPSAEEQAASREVADLFAAKPGVGMIGHKRSMLDRPYQVRAQAILALGAPR
jgi:citrate lyase beta subunit